MSLATNSNLNRTQATFRTVNASMAKFMSLSPEAQLLIVSNSCNINSNVFVLGSDSITRQTYLATGTKNNKLLSIDNSNVHFLRPTSIKGHLLSDGTGTLGTSDKRWNNVHLSGDEISINNAQIRYQETFSENYVITDYDISFTDKASGHYIPIAAQSLKLQNVDEYSTTLTTDQTGALLTSRRPDGTLIQSINLGLANTDMLPEGSNMYFTEARVRSLAASLNIQSSNYVEETSNNVIAYFQETSNNILTTMYNTTLTIASNLDTTSNQIFSNLNALDIKTSNYVKSMSNILSSNITAISSNIYKLNTTLDINMSNYVRITSNHLASNILVTIDTISKLIVTTSNNIISYQNTTSNQLNSNIYTTISHINTQLSVTDTNQSNIIKQTASNLNNTGINITTDIISQTTLYSSNTSNIISNLAVELNTKISNIQEHLNTYITDLDVLTSNNIKTSASSIASNLSNTSNTLLTRIENLTTDQIAQGTSNKFIVNGVYNSDLTVSNLTVIGNLVPSSNSVYDLGSPSKRWKDLYLTGNTIYLGDTALSSDPVTNGLSVKKEDGSLGEVVVAAIKLKDSSTGELISLQSVGNKINVSAVTEGSSGSALQKTLTTDIVQEGAKLYFTPARVGNIAQGSNILSSNYTSQVFTDISSHLNALTADNVATGTPSGTSSTSNTLIYNQTYASNLTIIGTLTTCNLQVIGQETIIRTQTFTTENMEILTQSYTGPALAIVQRGPNNIAEFYSNSTALPALVTINNSGHIGIGTTVPREALDVIGNIKFSGTINTITSNELMYIKGTSNNIQKQIDDTHTNSSNYIRNTSNTLSSNLNVISAAISQNITTSAINNSNITSNIALWMNTLFTNTSNDINSNITNIYNNTSNSTSNFFLAYSSRITTTSNTLSTRVTTWSTDTSNLISQTSNNLRISLSDMNSNINNLLTNLITIGWQTFPIVTQTYSVTNSGFTYLIDGVSSASLTIRNGNTYAFRLSLESSHPFQIRVSNGGAAITDGMIHIDTNGAVSTGAAANSGRTSGTLYWTVPDTGISSAVYQCVNHSSMVGNITINTTGALNKGTNLYINSNVGIGTSVTNAALDVAGDIRLSTGSNINGITTTVLAYLINLEAPIQTQINNIALTSSNYTSNMSNLLTSNMSTLFNTLNSNITNLDNLTSNYVNSTSNQLNSNLLAMTNTINTRLNNLNFTQWTPLQGSNIFFQNSVGIGTNVIGAGNKLEIFGGDLLVVGGTIKKSVDGRATENYQVERWKDNATYYSDANSRFITYTDGNVGIDVLGLAPYSPLHVGTATITSGPQAMSYFTSNAVAQIAQGSITLTDVCAIFDSSILVKDTIASSSDQRIKKNINDINDDSALQKIMAIEPKTYDYIDPMKGTDKVYGFIAQQIQEVIPEAVHLQKNVVPNIFHIADSYLNVITFDHDIIPYNLTIDTRISIIDLSGNQDIYTIHSVNQDSRSIILDRNISGDKVFVYGTEVGDFHTLDKSYIFTLNVCATQKLSEKIDNLTNRIAYIDFVTGQSL